MGEGQCWPRFDPRPQRKPPQREKRIQW